jgi:hypothetical protein
MARYQPKSIGQTRTMDDIKREHKRRTSRPRRRTVGEPTPRTTNFYGDPLLPFGERKVGDPGYWLQQDIARWQAAEAEDDPEQGHMDAAALGYTK